MRPGRGDEYSKAVQMVQHTDLKESKMMMMIMMNEVIFEFTLQSQLEFWLVEMSNKSFQAEGLYFLFKFWIPLILNMWSLRKSLDHYFFSSVIEQILYNINIVKLWQKCFKYSRD